MDHFHLGPWEADIGFSQAIKIGNRLIISGSTADTTKAISFEDQVHGVYKTLDSVLRQQGFSFKNVVKETIFTTDIEELKKHIEFRKSVYNGHLPAATWVEVRRLFAPEKVLEIELEAIRE